VSSIVLSGTNSVIDSVERLNLDLSGSIYDNVLLAVVEVRDSLNPIMYTGTVAL
jgi:hypothetical protein